MGEDLAADLAAERARLRRRLFDVRWALRSLADATDPDPARARLVKEEWGLIARLELLRLEALREEASRPGPGDSRR